MEAGLSVCLSVNVALLVSAEAVLCDTRVVAHLILG